MEEERKIKWVTNSLARESGVANCKERINTCNDNGDLTNNSEWAKCKCGAAGDGDGDEASTCRFSSTLPSTGIWGFFFFFFFFLRINYRIS